MSAEPLRVTTAEWPVVGVHWSQHGPAKELGPRSITVNWAVPGATLAVEVFTDSGEGDSRVQNLIARTPLGRLANPGSCGRGGQLSLVGEGAAFITGQHLAVDGGARASI